MQNGDGAPREARAGGRSGSEAQADDGAFDLASITVEDLRAELQRRQRRAAQLSRERAKLRARLADIEQELAELTVPQAPAAGRPPAADVRPFKVPLQDLTLVDALLRVVAVDEEVSPKLAEDRLREKGYGTRRSNLRASVSQALTSEKRFRRVARGRYLRTV